MSEVTTDTPPKLPFPAPLGAGGKEEPAEIKAPNDSPPKRRGRPPGSTNKGSVSISTIQTTLNEQFTLIGMGVMAFNEYDGKVVIEGADRMSKAIANLCEKNPKVRKTIERMLVGGSYGEVIIAAGLIAVPIMANHGMMPPGIQKMYGQAIPSEDELEQVA